MSYLLVQLPGALHKGNSARLGGSGGGGRLLISLLMTLHSESLYVPLSIFNVHHIPVFNLTVLTLPSATPDL